MPSARRVSFPGEHLPLVEIAQHYSDIEAAVRDYFLLSNKRYPYPRTRSPISEEDKS